jgi:hypothetical protein
MARTVAFSVLKEAVRQRYDLPAFSTTTWCTTAAVNALVNESLQGLAALLIGCYGDEYYSTTATLTATANTATTSLPTRCIKVLKLWWIRGTDDVVPICRGNADDTMLANYSAKSWTDYSPRYRLLGTASIQWLPMPSASYSVACHHVALPADLSGDSDTVECGLGWEQWVINDVCSKLAAREEKDPTAFLMARADWERRILEGAPDRIEGESLQLRDADGYAPGAYELRNILSRWS